MIFVTIVNCNSLTVKMSTGKKIKEQRKQLFAEKLSHPNIHLFIQHFLEEVHKKNLAMSQYYNWELADKDITTHLISEYSELLCTSKIANSCYIFSCKEDGFYFDEDQMNHNVWNILTDIKSILLGFNTNGAKYNEKDIFDDLHKLACIRMKNILVFLLREEILNSLILPKDILSLISDYVVAELFQPKKSDESEDENSKYLLDAMARSQTYLL